MNKTNKNEKVSVGAGLVSDHGITLVALVITIIVLIILAGVSINAVMNGGLIENAKEAKNKYEEAKTEEEQLLESLEMDEMAIEFLKHNVSYEFKNKFLTGVTPGTKAVTLMQELAKAGYDLYDVDGNQITAETPDTTIVTTGMEIQKDGTKIGNVVIYGDLNCDGLFSINEGNDVATICGGGSTSYTADYQKIAMDVDHDTLITKNDSNCIIAYYNGTESAIDQNVQAPDPEDIKVLTESEIIQQAAEQYVNEVQKTAKFKEAGYSFYWDEDYDAYRMKVEGTPDVTTVKAALRSDTIIKDYESEVEMTTGAVKEDDYLSITHNVVGTYSVEVMVAFIDLI